MQNHQCFLQVISTNPSPLNMVFAVKKKHKNNCTAVIKASHTHGRKFQGCGTYGSEWAWDVTGCSRKGVFTWALGLTFHERWRGVFPNEKQQLSLGEDFKLLEGRGVVWFLWLRSSGGLQLDTQSLCLRQSPHKYQPQMLSGALREGRACLHMAKKPRSLHSPESVWAVACNT